VDARVQPVSEADREFGAALEIWEGHACDPEVRYKGSSGGVLSALALYCLEQEGMASVLHIAADERAPWLNRSVMSMDRSQVLAGTGSRYSPASPCERLGDIEKSDRPCVFVGKPCDVAAVAMLRQERPALDRNLGLVLTFFCAGTPSTQATLDLLRSMGVESGAVKSLHYRGGGWPGSFRVGDENGRPVASLSYADSWKRLTSYRPLRCNVCPDGLGRLGDLSCGDAWHQAGRRGDQGTSLILVRTERGKEILRRAVAAKYVVVAPAGPSAVLAAQSSLLQRRRELFGRLLAMRLLGIPTPKFRRFSLLHSWVRLPLVRQVRTITGTLRRAIVRRWWKRRPTHCVTSPEDYRNA
jgi:coenzyme F420 hydrogenase subunit beta